MNLYDLTLIVAIASNLCITSGAIITLVFMLTKRKSRKTWLTGWLMCIIGMILLSIALIIRLVNGYFDMTLDCSFPIIMWLPLIGEIKSKNKTSELQ